MRERQSGTTKKPRERRKKPRTSFARMVQADREWLAALFVSLGKERAGLETLLARMLERNRIARESRILSVSQG